MKSQYTRLTAVLAILFLRICFTSTRAADADLAPGYPGSVTISGNYAYVAAGFGGLIVLDITDPDHPRRVGNYGGYHTNENYYSDPRGVAVSGHYAYLASPLLEIIDITAPSNPQRVAKGEPVLGGISGIVVSGEYAYTLEQRPGSDLYRGRIGIATVADPAQPRRVGAFETSGEIGGIAVQGNYLYVAEMPVWNPATKTNSGGGIRIIDVSNPSNPTRVGGFNTAGFPSAVALSGNYAFLVELSQSWDRVGLVAFDISNPSDPRRVGDFRTALVAYSSPPDPGSFSFVISGNRAYVAGLTGRSLTEYDSVLQVIDIANPASPKEVGGFELDGVPQGLAILENHAFVSEIRAPDVGGGRLEIIDITTPPNLRPVTVYDSVNIVTAVTVSADRGYLAENQIDAQGNEAGAGRLEIIGLANPTKPQQLGFYDIIGYPYLVAFAKDYAVLAIYSGTETRLQIIDVANPANPRPLGAYSASNVSFIAALSISRDYAYVATDEGLEVIDLTNPASPHPVGRYEITGPSALAISGDFAFVIESPAWKDTKPVGGGLHIIDISDPAHPQRVGFYPNPQPADSYAQNVAVSGNYAYISGGRYLDVIDISKPAAPSHVGGHLMIEGHGGIAISGSHLYVSAPGTLACQCSMPALQILDISDPTDPQRVASSPFPFTYGSGLAPTIFNGYAYIISTAAGGLGIIDVSTFGPVRRLDLPTVSAATGFSMHVRGNPGETMLIQRSRNLKDWEDFKSVTIDSGPQTISDTQTSIAGFYRARLLKP